jgi:hypothetical protein
MARWPLTPGEQAADSLELLHALLRALLGDRGVGKVVVSLADLLLLSGEAMNKSYYDVRLVSRISFWSCNTQGQGGRPRRRCRRDGEVSRWLACGEERS